MPHLTYIAALLGCPWPGCDYQAAMIDFRVEDLGDPALYARVVAGWYGGSDFGLVGRCPACGQYVFFGIGVKRAVADLQTIAGKCEILPDHWHTVASISPTEIA